MKFFFHPSYDSGYFLKQQEGVGILGTKVVGLAGLLDHLSLHNGLNGRFASDGERAAAYLTDVGKCAKGSWIEDSFLNDGLGTAKCLLGWRDSLIMAGWTPGLCGTEQTPKLQLLSRIEESWKARVIGTADRWLEFASWPTEQPILGECDTVICTCAKEQLPILVQKVLEGCNASFTEYPEEVLIPDGLKINVLHYRNLLDVYHQVASRDREDRVIINRDNVSLNHILLSWGKPLSDAKIEDSNPLSLQLFKLALSVFSRPLNIQNLLSYFLLPVGPIPHRLRSALADVLVSNGGFGEIDWDDLDGSKAKALKEAGISSKWEQAIWEYIEDECGHTNLSKEERRSRTALLRPITDSSYSPGKRIPVQTLKDHIGAINQWAASFAYAEYGDDGELQSQLGTVISFFKQLLETLEGRDSITYEDLEKSINTIYQPTSIVQARAQVGSLKVIENYQQLVDTPDSLLWLDCCGADVITDRYDFLSAQERTWLNKQDGILIPLLQDILELNRKEMITTLSKIPNGITLITADYHHNQKMAEHPFIAELKMQRGDKLEIREGGTDLPHTSSKPILKVLPKPEYNLGTVVYAGRSESNTSIETLINYPFDYAVHYVAKLGEPCKKELGTIERVTGLVAHLFIQNLVNDVKQTDGGNPLRAISDLVDKEFDRRLDKAVQSTGLALLLKENEVEYNNLKYLLRQSVKTLVAIMEQECLTPVGCEMKYEEPVFSDGSAFNARLDMELTDAGGDAVIFDFKWSYSAYYCEKIKNGTAVQLALYRKELEQKGKRVKAVGYYLLPKCILETSDFNTFVDTKTNKVIIHHIDPPANINLFERIQNSVFKRLEDIKAGVIEEGEEMDIKDLSYSQALLNGEDLIPVGVLKTKGRKSKTNPDPPIEAIKKDSHKVFVNKPESRFQKTIIPFESSGSSYEKATTYPLLKGRLK